ncbi:glycosyl transferase family protein [Rhodopila sp.]|uniref:glycosyl transferase family protein n=1 Tax=Rhodopila sp. TaxID=2480087 RepID=UPI003D10D381
MVQSADTEARFASFVATLGRGPGRSRALTREEARDAFGMVLRGEADPHQIGAFLMLLRFRGEDAEEITGLVQAARTHARLGQASPNVELDWPSYGAGRTRGAPWFLLAALALANSGTTILMHGSNDFSSGISVADGLHALGLRPAAAMATAADDLRRDRFAYLPLHAMAPAMDRLLEMRRLFGLRSPVNTVARLLNPANAPFGVDGVFHPPYIDVHLGVAERMGRSRLLVLKGGGGEAERVPLKAATAALWDRRLGREDVALPAVAGLPAHPTGEDTPTLLAAVWRGEATPQTPLATIQATIALALLAMGRAADPAEAMAQAGAIWTARRRVFTSEAARPVDRTA